MASFSNKKITGFIGGFAAFLLIVLFVDLKPGSPEVTYTLAIAVLMAMWWISEVLPIAVTALLPVVLFPLFGVMNGEAVSSAYFNDIIFLFLGGFIIALSMERWNLHRRIALKILMIIGVGPGRLMMGFMLATAFLSMWISNTATTMMMIPIVVSIIRQLEENADEKEAGKYATGLLLGIAYSASIGGATTLVGTPPNLVFAKIFDLTFEGQPEISFAKWIIFALPLSAVLLVVLWGYIYLIFKPSKKSWQQMDTATFSRQYRELGSISFEEKVVLYNFVVFALLLLFRSDISLGDLTIPGWANLFSAPDYINDGTVAIAVAMVLFFVPTKNNQKALRVMDWSTARRLPWNIVLLFGGGFALALGFSESGLSLWIGNQLGEAVTHNPFFLLLTIAFGMCFLTEVTSNTATTQMLLPVLAGIAVSARMNPLLFMLPATMASSMAFMLPVATPPNAIVFGTNRLRMSSMAKTGFVLNLISITLIATLIYYWGATLFDIHFQVFPAWAAK